jgi:DNA-binding SARP family transcriptional activator
VNATAPAPTVFLSYRRHDTGAHARRLRESLLQWFGPEQLFMDVDAIEPGVDYLHALNEALAASDALIVLIGPGWLAPGPSGRPRLEDPDDFVRIEIRAGLERGIRVIPLLFDGARFPPVDQLPSDIQGLAYLQALDMDGERWTTNLERLRTAVLAGAADDDLAADRTGRHHRRVAAFARPERVRISLIGPMEVTLDGRPLPLGSPRQRALLALLVTEAGQVVPLARIVDVLWGADPPEQAAATVQTYVSNLRRVLRPTQPALGRELIATVAPGYMIEPVGDVSDLARFHQLARGADDAMARGDDDTAIELLRAGNDLRRGPVLADLRELLPAAARLLQAPVSATLEKLGALELERGRHREVLEDLRLWSEQDPLHESLRALLMLALYRCGRRADALAEFEKGRAVLEEAHGIEPSRSLRELRDAILSQDPSIDLRASARPGGPVDLAFANSTILRSTTTTTSARLVLDDQTFDLRHAVTSLGRHPDRDVILRDPKASRRHAKVVRVETGYQIEDEGSANGTYVNDERVDGVQDLHDGDVLRIGDTQLHFEIL